MPTTAMNFTELDSVFIMNLTSGGNGVYVNATAFDGKQTSLEPTNLDLQRYAASGTNSP